MDMLEPEPNNQPKEEVIKSENIKCEFDPNGINLKVEHSEISDNPFVDSDDGSEYRYNSGDESSDYDYMPNKIATPLISYDLTEVEQQNSKQCGICSKTFKTLKELRIHLRVHTDERPYKCTLCDKGFKQSSALNAHMITHSGAKDYKCHVCNFAFTTSSSLKRHTRKVHEFSKTYKCSLCNETFLNAFHLKEHRENHLKQTGSRETRDAETGIIKYNCGICAKSFSKREKLFQHVALHIKEKLKCKHCSSSFLTSATLNAHINAIHGVIVCSLCTTEFRSRRYFIYHERDHFRDIKRNACDYCKETYESPEEMKNHMQTRHFQNSETASQCTICLKVFANESHLKYHRSLSHINCNKCMEFFETEAQLKIHKFLKHKRGAFKCKKCRAVFRLRSHLAFHMNNVHLIVTPFKCKLCKNKTFGRFRNYYLHIKSHVESSKYCKITPRGQAMVFQCKICKKELGKRYKVLRHLVTHHAIKEKKYECEQCSRCFWNCYSFSKHKRKMHSVPKNHKCKLCDISYRNYDSLMVHINRDHEINKPVTCTYCNVTLLGTFKLHVHLSNDHDLHVCNRPFCFKHFKTRAELNEHKSLIHVKVAHCDMCKEDVPKRQYKSHRLKFHNIPIPLKENLVCKLCGLISTSPFSSNLHKYRKHKESLPPELIAKFESYRVKCDKCDVVCSNKSRLNKHMLMHEKDTEELVCEICNKVFRAKSGLVTHQNKIHAKQQKTVRVKKEPIVSDTVFNCKFCEKTYTIKRSLRSHVKRKHSVPGGADESTEIQCDICNKVFQKLCGYISHRTKVHGIARKIDGTNGVVKKVDDFKKEPSKEAIHKIPLSLKEENMFIKEEIKDGELDF